VIEPARSSGCLGQRRDCWIPSNGPRFLDQSFHARRHRPEPSTQVVFPAPKTKPYQFLNTGKGPVQALMTIFVVLPEPESLNATIVSHGETIHWSEPLLRRMSKFVPPEGRVWRGEIASSVNAQGSSSVKSDRWAFPLFQRTGLAGSSAAALAKFIRR